MATTDEAGYPAEWVDKLARAMVERDGDDWDEPSLTPDTPRDRAEEFRESYREAARAQLDVMVPLIGAEALRRAAGYVEAHIRDFQIVAKAGLDRARAEGAGADEIALRRRSDVRYARGLQAAIEDLQELAEAWPVQPSGSPFNTAAASVLAGLLSRALPAQRTGPDGPGR